jgi:hypothetical protein
LARPAFFSVTRGWFTHQLSRMRVTRWVGSHEARMIGTVDRQER